MLEELESQLTQGKDIEALLEKYDWRKFESAIAEIFKKNEFHTKQNFRFKTKRRYEIDIIAIKNNQIFCIDCKWWGRGRYKKSGLKKAVISQEKRTMEFTKFLKRNIVAQRSLKLTSEYRTCPLVVTLRQEDIVHQNKTYVVPAWKVNRFLVGLDNLGEV